MNAFKNILIHCHGYGVFADVLSKSVAILFITLVALFEIYILLILTRLKLSIEDFHAFLKNIKEKLTFCIHLQTIIPSNLFYTQKKALIGTLKAIVILSN